MTVAIVYKSGAELTEVASVKLCGHSQLTLSHCCLLAVSSHVNK